MGETRRRKIQREGEPCISHVDLGKVLLEVGAKVVALDNNNDTPLRYVAAYGEKECVALLLDYVADITLQDKDSDTPIDGAKLQN
ncbi:hypothetical protein Lser_V15G46123 [Lactuca serriola]